jgi:hypothetical protein
MTKYNKKTLMMITFSAWRNEVCATCGGFGALLGKEATRALKSIRLVSSRILVVILEVNPTTNVFLRERED